jgi:hypothetical protein
LRCHYENDFTGPLAIPLEPQPWQGNRVYARRCTDLITIDRSELTNHDIFQNGPFVSNNQAQPQNQNIIIHRKPKHGNPDCENLHLESWPTDCILRKVIPEKQWDSKSRIIVDDDDYDVNPVFIFEHVTSKTRFAIVFGYSHRFREPALGKVKVLELDPNVLDSPPWLRDGQSDPRMDMEWSQNSKNQIDPILLFRGEGMLKGIRAALRKGHIMGVPFFVLNVQAITRTAASV